MRNHLAACLFCLTTLAGSYAIGQETGVDCVPLLKDSPAPFSGVLVPEGRFVAFLEAEQKLAEVKGELEIEKKAGRVLESMYVGKLELAVKPLSWYQTPEFNRWLGFGLGVVVTAGAVWGGYELVKEIRK